MSDVEMYNFKKMKRMRKKVLYNKEPLTLILFHGSPCLWIHDPWQREIPKMEFVGGFPDEWCIYIYKLTEEEKKQIKDENGNILDICKELKRDDFIEIKDCIKKFANSYVIAEGIFNKDCYPPKIQEFFSEEIKIRTIKNDEVEKLRKVNYENNNK